MWTFCDDVQKREFYVPAGLLRVEDPPEQQHEDNPYGAQHWCSNSQSLRS
jgi:hypothetical protein